MRLALVLALLLGPLAADAANVLVVLSGERSSSYSEALEGFRSEWPEEADVVSADGPSPAGPYGVVVALGGRAARRASRYDAPLVVALAPGYRVGARRAKTVKIAMTPSPESFARIVGGAGVRRLLAVRGPRVSDGDFPRLASEWAERFGVALVDRALTSPGALPRLLRDAGRDADGIWLAPDPAAVTPETFGAVREFARARGIPFFAPAEGLVSEGARGELTVSFRDCGREAAKTARSLLAGRAVSEVVYPVPPGREVRVALSTPTADAH